MGPPWSVVRTGAAAPSDWSSVPGVTSSLPNSGGRRPAPPTCRLRLRHGSGPQPAVVTVYGSYAAFAGCRELYGGSAAPSWQRFGDGCHPAVTVMPPLLSLRGRPTSASVTPRLTSACCVSMGMHEQLQLTRNRIDGTSKAASCPTQCRSPPMQLVKTHTHNTHTCVKFNYV